MYGRWNVLIKDDTAPKSLPTNQRESTRRRQLRVEKIYEKVPLKVHTTIRFLDKSSTSLRVPGRKSIQPPGYRTKVHPASGFHDESSSSLRVPRRKVVQPPGSRTKVHPASGFLDENPYNLRFMKIRIHKP
ncbi:hypothetical protein YC2023_082204 [Brassica napus]